MALYREFRSQEEIDAQYNIALLEPDFLDVVTAQFALSAETRDKYASHLKVPYGPTVEEYLDIYPADTPNAPVLVFLHGGYWSMPMIAKDFAGVARGPFAHDVTTVVVNYALAPAVTLDEITRQCRAAIAWLHRHVGEYGGDPARMVVSGHSAGGHLVAMLALTDWVADYALPADVLKAGISISGLFDLGPFPYSWLAPSLLLTHETLVRQSPLFHIRPVAVPLVVTLGGNESAEFHRQTGEFLDAWKAAGNTGDYLALPGENHLSSYATYADPTSTLTTATVELIGRWT